MAVSLAWLTAAILAANPGLQELSQGLGSSPNGAPDLEPPADPQAIYGGQPVDPGSWPSVVAVGTTKLCTGTLVSPTLVLTAAHCFEPAPSGTVTVSFGDTLADPTLVVGSKEWGAHAEFCLPSDCGEEIHDFAWVRLPAPVDTDLYPPTPPITDQAEFDELMAAGAPLTFIGFGQDEQGGVGVKREVESALSSFTATGREFRAGGEGADSCFGDSGGPAMAQTSDGQWRLAGVLSRGGECGEGGIYGVPLPELCWLSETSGVSLLPPGCESCDCVDLPQAEPENEGCACVVGDAQGGDRGENRGSGAPAWAWLGLAGLGLAVRGARARRRA